MEIDIKYLLPQLQVSQKWPVPFSFNMSLLLRICTREITHTNICYSFKNIILKIFRDSAIPNAILMFVLRNATNTYPLLHRCSKSFGSIMTICHRHFYLITHRNLLRKFVHINEISCSLLWIKTSCIGITVFLCHQIPLSEEAKKYLISVEHSRQIFFQTMIFSITQMHYTSCAKINTLHEIWNTKYEIW